MSNKDQYSVRKQLNVGSQTYNYYSLPAFEEQGHGKINNLPFSIKVLLEAAIRQLDGKAITSEHVKQIANWAVERDANKEIPFIPARIVLQDFTGVPVVVDLAAMRDTMKRAGGDPKRINPLVPVDLVIDHSVMVDAFGSKDALEFNEKKSSSSAMKNATVSCVGRKRRSTTSVRFRRIRGSFTKSTWSTWHP